MHRPLVDHEGHRVSLTERDHVWINASCPTGTIDNAGNASTCIDDYGNEPCTDVTNGVTPASCNSVCQ